jgi:hypothetical protein
MSGSGKHEIFSDRSWLWRGENFNVRDHSFRECVLPLIEKIGEHFSKIFWIF